MNSILEKINCPYCGQNESSLWANENGFSAVKCSECGLVYVNPRPVLSLISEAVRTGVHSEVEHNRTAVARRVSSKVTFYKKILASMFSEVWHAKRPISWLDVGAGYGEVIEAVSLLAMPGSKIEGIEPMKPKANHARARGLRIWEAFPSEITEKFEFVSIINVFSHIPDFRGFIDSIKKLMVCNGELLIESGNAGDIRNYHDVPTELDLPDHLVFAGEKHIVGYLKEAGFSIVAIKRIRKDGFLNFVKNIIKKHSGRQVSLKIPYTSPHRSILIRAKLLPQSSS
jgi:Zn ribbon nucleic-acid-binding protein